MDDELKEKILKIFDNALSDVDTNLRDSFTRFTINEIGHEPVKDKEDIIGVMMKTVRK